MIKDQGQYENVLVRKISLNEQWDHLTSLFITYGDDFSLSRTGHERSHQDQDLTSKRYHRV